MSDPTPSAVLSDAFPVTGRSRLRRAHQRGSHEHADVYALLDTAPMCHVGYVIDGQAYVTPTLHWRVGNHVYWHGSSASRFLRQAQGTQVCLTVAMLDGYVMARSAFNHSVNFRSAMVFGRAFVVEDDAAKTEHLRDMVEGLFPGRWETLRPMTAQELKATAVLGMAIDEASAKVRSGPPGDGDEADVPVWAGELPVSLTFGTPRAAPEMPADVALPPGLADWIGTRRF
ncbi:hypothetical protein AA103196_2494 [Ameyamaea chiangmaiensis NBRC 103196]|uniref:Pyridoxamine 5'-phosphate oxidase family protein n=1 Tax=Ameyamaea chiangmaiensis TaxID=442969 RepID=A0A850PDB4_9PROT|nr:pyridoxamine 5'-phosphate oxidase family protein [Ameyamaea chiangmaiensis]MBS4075703.1 pyridoxamine 5'-phosphate oxidase family protein [Ameyamaea chiangmaiensis]NVN40276.1 pyridoxamine 5'-phosphate oxidase family protein [Ameyamaea chiangmaiensis]GBQ70452.1 hypothetical protein AA103196_2494 [Ameyamaea chiangmaiensis NBRC 103196]